VARDSEVAARLWRVCASLVGLPITEQVAPGESAMETSGWGAA
jgi:hypothetical protein